MINLKIDFNSNFSSLIPIKIRKAKQNSWLATIFAPMDSLNQRFRNWAYNKRYVLSFTGQQIYLEHLLNDRFDAVGRGIYIDDPLINNQDIAVSFYRVENQISASVYYRNEPHTEISALFYRQEFNIVPHFIIYVPVNLHNNQVESLIRGLVNFYKIAGKHYLIKTY
jgi:hypothetical protein